MTTCETALPPAQRQTQSGYDAWSWRGSWVLLFCSYYSRYFTILYSVLVVQRLLKRTKEAGLVNAG